MKPILITLLFLLGICCSRLGYATDTNQASMLKPVKLALHWYPQTQFAGYYLALKKGFYKKHGLDMKISAKDHQYTVAELLTDKKTDFAVMWLSTAIEQHSRGIPLIHLAQIVQRSSLMLIARKAKNIRQPQDMNNRKISIWPKDLSWQPLAFLNKYQIKATVIPQSNTVNLFLNDGVDVVSAMYYNEYHTILNSGLNEDELSLFFFYDYQLNFPEDGLYCLEERFIADPATCNAFVRASVEGWHYAFSHEEETLDIVLKIMQLAGVTANRTHQRWMLHKMKDLVQIKDRALQLGILDPRDYQTVAQELKKTGVISEITDFNRFCRGTNAK